MMTRQAAAVMNAAQLASTPPLIAMLTNRRPHHTGVFAGIALASLLIYTRTVT
jgi:hypothetical protein